jgi:hypothetical protein
MKSTTHPLLHSTSYKWYRGEMGIDTTMADEELIQNALAP